MSELLSLFAILMGREREWGGRVKVMGWEGGGREEDRG
jgi:hypothetical protein